MALFHFLKNTTTTEISKVGHFRNILSGKFPHFVWFDNLDSKFYHFEAKYEDEPFLGNLWFLGKVKEFPSRMILNKGVEKSGFFRGFNTGVRST